MRYIDSSSIPYLILSDPPGALGEQAIVLKPRDQTICHAIVGENHAEEYLGASLALDQALRLQSDSDPECILLLFLGTSLGPSFIPSIERVNACGQSLWNRLFPVDPHAHHDWHEVLVRLFHLPNRPEEYRNVTPGR